MLSLLSYKVMDFVFNGVSIPAIFMLFIAILISAFNIYKSLFSSYWDISLLLTVLLTSLIKYITGSGLLELPYMSIL